MAESNIQGFKDAHMSDDRRCWDSKSEKHGLAFLNYLAAINKALMHGVRVREVFTTEDNRFWRRAYNAADGSLIAELDDVHHCPPEPPQFCDNQA